MSSISKARAVRMFESAYELVVRLSMSDKNAGRLAQDVQQYRDKLNRLVRHDPYQKFWKVLGNANAKVIRFVRMLQS